jgi:hypothetical protein
MSLYMPFDRLKDERIRTKGHAMNSHTLNRKLGFAVARAARPAPAQASRPLDADEALRHTLLSRLEGQPWWDSAHSNVFVDAGAVVYQGLVVDTRARRLAQQVAQALPGVRSVWDARVPRREWQAMA